MAHFARPANAMSGAILSLAILLGTAPGVQAKEQFDPAFQSGDVVVAAHQGRVLVVEGPSAVGADKRVLLEERYLVLDQLRRSHGLAGFEAVKHQRVIGELLGKPGQQVIVPRKGVLELQRQYASLAGMGLLDRSLDELENLYQWRLDQGIPNLFFVSAALIRETGDSGVRGDPETVSEWDNHLPKFD